CSSDLHDPTVEIIPGALAQRPPALMLQFEQLLQLHLGTLSSAGHPVRGALWRTAIGRPSRGRDERGQRLVIESSVMPAARRSASRRFCGSIVYRGSFAESSPACTIPSRVNAEPASSATPLTTVPARCPPSTSAP